MQPPPNTKIYEGEIATYWFDEDGILHSLSKSPRRTVENIKGNVALIKQITNNEKVCIIVYVSNSGKPDKATRQYAAEQLPNIYKAMAMISKNGLAKFIINFIFGMSKPSIPMKTFTDVAKAKEWLKQYK